MTELTAFQSAYNTAREYFNRREFSTTAELARVDTTGLNVRILGLVCLMLIHNAELGDKDLDINTLRDYDLNTFNDQEAFKPYITYLLSLKKGRGKRKIPKKADLPSLYAAYVATFIKYLFIAQNLDVGIIQ